MKILLIHNAYIERGGEDEIVRTQQQMLEQNAHEIRLYSRNNDEIGALGLVKQIKCLLQDTCWNTAVYQEVRQLIQSFRPEIVHIHNTFYLISPSVYQACVDEGVPVVQSLHNYRLLLDKGNPDQFPEFTIPLRDFKKHLLRYSIVPRVLRSFAAHKILEKIDAFIALSRFSLEKFVQAGFPEEKLHMLAPAFSIPKAAKETIGKGIIFVGRLVDYKGVPVLLRTFSKNTDLPLRIVGDGPLKHEVETFAKVYPNIKYLGRLNYEQTLQEIRQAACLVAPSYCYETFGRIVVEAFGCGTPVIASNHGAMAELIEEGKSGLLVEPGNEAELTQKIRQLLSMPDFAQKMGRYARSVFERSYAKSDNLQQLLAIYQKVLEKGHEKLRQIV